MPVILFGQSYFLRFDSKLWKAMQPYPPLGVLYAASYLRSKGFDVALFDAMLAESTTEWTKALGTVKPAYAVLYEDNFNYLSKMCLLRMREAAFEMIGAARETGCTIIIAGADASDNAGDYLSKGADFVIAGEGEQTLYELLLCLDGRDSRRPNEIPGVASRERPVPSAPREIIRELDALPFPAWDLVDWKRYRQIWKERHGYYSINMVTTRGCPYHCNWCAKPIWGQRYHSRSPENVVQEMAFLRDRFHPDHIWFVDDIFGLKRGWIEDFSRLVVEHGVRTPFKCLLRTDLVNDTVARALAAAGCEMVWLGAESGAQRVLEAMDKGTTVEDTYRATHLLHAAGIRVAYFLQFGYPGEDWEEIRLTFKMVRENMPDDIGVSVSYPLPGTRFYESVTLGSRRNWVDSEDLALLFQGRFCPDFYRVLHRVLHKEYRARRVWREWKKGHWASPVPVLKRGSLVFDRLALRRLRMQR